jgi:hypothetical protein
MQMLEDAPGVGAGSGAVVEVRDVVGGHLAFGALVGSSPDAVSCFCPLLAGYVHCGRDSPVSRCAVGSPNIFAQGSFLGRYGC